MSPPARIALCDVSSGAGRSSKALDDLRCHLTDGRNEWIVFTGAGVSTRSGIPDFRSPEGLFAKTYPSDNGTFTAEELLNGKIVWTSGHALKSHCKFIQDFHNEVVNAKPNTFHDCLAQNVENKRVRRIYTMNVDSFHTKALQDAGLVRDPVVHLHGVLEMVRCAECGYRTTWQDDGLLDTECPKCLQGREIRLGGPSAVGRLRTDVLLYDDKQRQGELEFIQERVNEDTSRPVKIFLVAGTRLALPDSKNDVLELGLATRRKGGINVWLGREEPPLIKGWPGWDYVVIGDCLDFVKHMMTSDHEHDGCVLL